MTRHAGEEAGAEAPEGATAASAHTPSVPAPGTPAGLGAPDLPDTAGGTEGSGEGSGPQSGPADGEGGGPDGRPDGDGGDSSEA